MLGIFAGAPRAPFFGTCGRTALLAATAVPGLLGVCPFDVLGGILVEVQRDQEAKQQRQADGEQEGAKQTDT